MKDLQKNRTKRMCVNRRKVCVKEVGPCNYGHWELQNLQGEPAGWRPREEPMLQLESEGRLLAEFPFPGEGLSFCSLQAFN